jgi:Flp pilus assembly protein TadD
MGETQLMYRTSSMSIRPLAAACLLLLAGCAIPANKDGKATADLRNADAARFASQAEKALRDKNYAKAEEYGRKAVEAAPDLAGAWNNFGVALMEQQKYMDAAQSFKRAADLTPTDPTPYENLGLVYFRAGFDDEALRWYGESLSRDPNWLPSLRGAVACSQRLHKSDEATLERTKRGLMLERNTEWREFFERHRLRVEADLEERKKSGGKS